MLAPPPSHTPGDEVTGRESSVGHDVCDTAGGHDEVDGTKRENGAETALPDQARIGLAELVYLTFSVSPR